MAGKGTNVDNLNFGLIIDDSDFNRKIKEDLEKAKKFNKDLAEYLKIKVQSKTLISDATVKNADKFLQQAREIAQTLGTLPSSVKVFNDETGKSEGNVKKANRELSHTRDLMSELAQLTGVTFGLAGIKSFINSLVRVSGEFEVSKMALTSMLQDANKANVVFEQLKQNALASPYTFQDLTKYAKQLTAFNIDADQLVETEKRLADVAAGLGVDMQRIILAYGQVKSAGVLKGTELRQFTEAGVPLLQSLADQIERTEGKTISLSQVFDRISKKQIPFEMVEQAFRDMTSEGGKFYNMQEVLVETLQGKIGKLKDAWTQMLYAIGNQNGGVLKDAVDLATNLVLGYERFGWVVSALVKTVGAYGAALAVAAVSQKMVAGGKAIAEFISLAKSIKTAKDAMIAFELASKGAALSLGLITAVGFGVYELVKHLNTASAAQKRLNDATYNYEKAADEEISKLNLLKYKLDNAKKGTEEWNGVKKEIVQNYGQYFTGLDNEITKVGSLETAYDNLVVSIKNSIAARSFSDFYSGEKSGFDNAKDKFLKDIQEKMDRIDKAQSKIVLQRVREYMDSHDYTEGEGYSGLVDLLHSYEKGGISLMTELHNVVKAQNTFSKNVQDYADRTGLSDGRLFNAETYINSLIGGGKKDTKPTWTPPQGKGKTQAQKDIETTIDSVKDLQRAYKELIDAGFSTEDTNKIIDAGFEYLDASTRRRRDFWEMLNELADELDKFDHEAADRLRGDIGRGKAKEAADAQKKEIKDAKDKAKALADYQKVLRQWQNEDFNLGGTGFEFDVRKIASDYNTALGKIDEKYLNAVEAAKKAHAGNAEEIAEETERLKKLAEAERLYEQAKAQEKINGLAKSYLDSQYSKNDISLDHIADMSIRQLRTLKDKLDAIRSTFFTINEEDKATLGLAGIDDINNLPKNLEEILNGDLDNQGKIVKDMLDAETVALLRLMAAAQSAGVSFDKMKDDVDNALKTIFKDIDEKTAEKISNAISGVAGLADAFSGLAEAAGNSELASALSAVSEIASGVGNAITQFAKGNYLSAVVSLISAPIKLISKNVKAQRELKEAIRETSEEARRSSLSNTLSDSVDSMFGENAIQKIKNAQSVINSLNPRMDVHRSTASVVDRKVKKSVKQMADELGMDLYDSYGNLNADTLQKILSTYKKLGDSEKAWIQTAIDDSEAYKEAMEQLQNTMDGIFGDLTADAASKIVDHWKNMGDAALDYSDILDDVGTKYAEMIVQSMLLDKIFNKDMQDSLWEKFQNNDVEGAMAIIANGMDTIATLAPAIESALEPIRPYIKSASSSSDNTLKEGINKELVEGNSSLIASYMNAIRADVSVTRQDIHSYLPMIASDLHSYVGGPSLANYQAEVQAHLANIDEYNSQIAQSNAEMLRHIRSVITSSSSGGSAIRTTK